MIIEKEGTITIGPDGYITVSDFHIRDADYHDIEAMVDARIRAAVRRLDGARGEPAENFIRA